MDNRSERSQMTKSRRRTRMKQPNHRRRQLIRNDVLPDDVLLEIFDFYMKMHSSFFNEWRVEAWQPLVHVCRRWRSLVLASPRRLNLRLYCTPKTPVRDTLDVWPALPLVVGGSLAYSSGTDNIIAALGQSNRICQVDLDLAGWQLEEILAAMQVPFPELTDLRLFSDGDTMPVTPASFLDGSAPRLRFFEMTSIQFPGLPKLLFSATHLVTLRLYSIPHSSYISPEAIVALISVLSSLTTLSLGFQSPQSCPDRETRRPPPPKRSVIPSLDHFVFNGVVEYLEDLVTCIDTPQLDNMRITFFNQIDFDTPRLAQFIDRTPKLGKRDAAVGFHDNVAYVRLSPGTLEIGISCIPPDWQLSSIEQVCNSSSHLLSMVANLYIDHLNPGVVWKNEAIENALWLQLLLPFTAVKNLYLYQRVAPGIAAALQELVEGRITEVLPSLQKIFVKELRRSSPVQENIGQFVADRQLSGHIITISDW